MEKATGLAVVAGGFTEGLVLWGIGTIIIAQVIAIVWLFRAFSRESWMRNLVSAVSICLSGLMLLLVGAFFWTTWFWGHR
jgi:hypothetical protein